MKALVELRRRISHFLSRYITGGRIAYLMFFCNAFLVGFAAWYYRGGFDLLPAKDVARVGPAPELRGEGTPRVCIGYNPETNAWGGTRWLCPKNHAMYANDPTGGAWKGGPPERADIHALCCPLPADDILTENHSYTEFERCPDQWVATGGSGPCEQGCAFRCTQINSERYQLGPETQSFHSQNISRRVYGRGLAGWIRWQDIPIAIRVGLARSTHQTWGGATCIGFPFGSLLTRKLGKRCGSFFYRQLQYKDGTPVKMFPDCQGISDPYDPHATCLSEPTPGGLPNDFR